MKGCCFCSSSHSPSLQVETAIRSPGLPSHLVPAVQTPLCLHAQTSPVGYSPWGHKELHSDQALCLLVLGIRRTPTPAWQADLKQPLGGEHRTPTQTLA